MNRIGHKRRTKIGTWSISICLHLVAIIIFSRLGLSQNPKSVAINRAPETKISRVKEIIDSVPIMPRPKISKAIGTHTSINLNIPVNPANFQPSPRPATIAKLASAGATATLPTNSSASSVEFFGNRSYQRKICYIVDASGSMQGIFSSVRQNLKQSIQNLQPDQYFNIIFFGSGTLLHFNGTQLVRAAQKNKIAAYTFIDDATPGGATNAMTALTEAMRLRDSLGKAPEMIYFLTDGFELSDQQSGEFLYQLLNFRKNLAPETKINTIGFWAQPADCRLLRKIAQKCNGTFIQWSMDSNE